MSRRENPCHNGTVIAADPIDAALAAHRWDEALRLIDVHTGCRARIVQVYDLVVGTLADVCHGA